MKDFYNDLAHIFFAAFILWLPVAGILGYVIAGVYIGLLAELKENDSNISRAFLKGISWRDIGGYALGGLVIGIVKEVI